MESGQVTPRGFNKGHSSKFHLGSPVQQTLKEGWRTYRPKRYGNNNKDEDNNPKTLNEEKLVVLQIHEKLKLKFRRGSHPF